MIFRDRCPTGVRQTVLNIKYDHAAGETENDMERKHFTSRRRFIIRRKTAHRERLYDSCGGYRGAPEANAGFRRYVSDRDGRARDENREERPCRRQRAEQFVDEIVEGPGIKDLWKLMNISHDRFIRTTDKYHEEAVKRYSRGFTITGIYTRANMKGFIVSPAGVLDGDTGKGRKMPGLQAPCRDGQGGELLQALQVR